MRKSWKKVYELYEHYSEPDGEHDRVIITAPDDEWGKKALREWAEKYPNALVRELTPDKFFKNLPARGNGRYACRKCRHYPSCYNTERNAVNCFDMDDGVIRKDTLKEAIELFEATTEIIEDCQGVQHDHDLATVIGKVLEFYAKIRALYDGTKEYE